MNISFQDILLAIILLVFLLHQFLKIFLLLAGFALWLWLASVDVDVVVLTLWPSSSSVVGAVSPVAAAALLDELTATVLDNWLPVVAVVVVMDMAMLGFSIRRLMADCKQLNWSNTYAYSIIIQSFIIPKNCQQSIIKVGKNIAAVLTVRLISLGRVRHNNNTDKTRQGKHFLRFCVMSKREKKKHRLAHFTIVS